MKLFVWVIKVKKKVCEFGANTFEKQTSAIKTSAPLHSRWVSIGKHTHAAKKNNYTIHSISFLYTGTTHTNTLVIHTCILRIFRSSEKKNAHQPNQTKNTNYLFYFFQFLTFFFARFATAGVNQMMFCFALIFLCPLYSIVSNKSF